MYPLIRPLRKRGLVLLGSQDTLELELILTGLGSNLSIIGISLKICLHMTNDE